MVALARKVGTRRHSLSLALALLLALTLVPAARAERKPSPELRFRITLAPDSITVGDPILAKIEAEAPNGASLLLPQFADSVGPFTVLSADHIVRANKNERALLTQEVKLTLFEAGEAEFPALPLLWVRADGETLSASSTPSRVRVGSLLEPELAKQAKTGQPATPDASFLRGVKGVVSLGRPTWWIWAAGAALLALIGFLLWRRFGRRTLAAIAPPLPPPVAPEIAFETGLDALLAGGFLDRGELKEFYLELSRLLRVFLEDRFHWTAVEGTRLEILEAAERAGFTKGDQDWLGTWLLAGDMVKFARGDRLLTEAREDAESSRAWVRRIVREALDRDRAARVAETAPMSEAPAPPLPTEVPR